MNSCVSSSGVKAGGGAGVGVKVGGAVGDGEANGTTRVAVGEAVGVLAGGVRFGGAGVGDAVGVSVAIKMVAVGFGKVWAEPDGADVAEGMGLKAGAVGETGVDTCTLFSVRRGAFKNNQAAPPQITPHNNRPTISANKRPHRRRLPGVIFTPPNREILPKRAASTNNGPTRKIISGNKTINTSKRSKSLRGEDLDIPKIVAQVRQGDKGRGRGGDKERGRQITIPLSPPHPLLLTSPNNLFAHHNICLSEFKRQVSGNIAHDFVA